MRALHFLPTVLLALALPACSNSTKEGAPTAAPESAAPPALPDRTASPKQATASPVRPLDKKQFGAPITESKTTALPDILKEPARFGGQTVRTEGVVSAVCKSMGCWMEIADESGSAHVKMASHSFFVPREASGHRAVIQGKMLSSPEGDACTGTAKDGCREQAEDEAGRVAKVEIEATGVEFLD